jgi:hypothetical protein
MNTIELELIKAIKISDVKLLHNSSYAEKNTIISPGKYLCAEIDADYFCLFHFTGWYRVPASYFKAM